MPTAPTTSPFPPRSPCALSFAGIARIVPVSVRLLWPALRGRWFSRLPRCRRPPLLPWPPPPPSQPWPLPAPGQTSPTSASTMPCNQPPPPPPLPPLPPFPGVVAAVAGVVPTRPVPTLPARPSRVCPPGFPSPGVIANPTPVLSTVAAAATAAAAAAPWLTCSMEETHPRDKL